MPRSAECLIRRVDPLKVEIPGLIAPKKKTSMVRRSMLLQYSPPVEKNAECFESSGLLHRQISNISSSVPPAGEIPRFARLGEPTFRIEVWNSKCALR